MKIHNRSSDNLFAHLCPTGSEWFPLICRLESVFCYYLKYLSLHEIYKVFSYNLHTTIPIIIYSVEEAVEDPFNLNMITGDDDIAYHDRVKSNNSVP